MTDKTTGSDDEKVGYARPPRNTQFKKGQSGNPAGRPRASQNFTTILDKELKAKISVIENGRRRNITKFQAAVKQLVNKAASGCQKSIKLLLDAIRAADMSSSSTGGHSAGSELVDDSIARDIAAQILRRSRGESDESN